MVVFEFLFVFLATVSVRLIYLKDGADQRIEEYLAQLNKAKQLLRQRSDLANEIAHEIKNPLTAILCSAETLDLLLSDKLEDDHLQSLRYIKEYGDNLLKLVSDFLDFSRAEIGHLKSNPSAVNVNDAIDSVIGLLEAQAIQKKIEIDFIKPKQDLHVWMDGSHLKQILFNLVHNAIKFTEVGGQVQISAQRNFPAPEVKIAVKDNGIGLSPDKVKQIFDIYSKVSCESTTEDVGTGLGLTLCKTLIEQAKGAISVSSKLGVGSVFEFLVPSYKVVGNSEEQELEEATATIIKKKTSIDPLMGQQFLLVDRDKGSRVSMTKLIQALGGAVQAVENATDAITMIQESEYDAVLIDQKDNDKEMLTLKDLLKSNSESKETKIIITGEDVKHIMNCDLEGVDQVLSKPVNGKSLLKTLIKSGKYSISH